MTLAIAFVVLVNAPVATEICAHHCIEVNQCRQSYEGHEYDTGVLECLGVCHKNRAAEEPGWYLEVWGLCHDEFACNWVLCVEAD